MAPTCGGWLLIWRLNASSAYGVNKFAGVSNGSRGFVDCTTVSKESVASQYADFDTQKTKKTPVQQMITF